MNLTEKQARAQEVLASIINHDDADVEEIREVLADLKDFMGDELDNAIQRREAKEEQESEQ